MPMTTIKFNGQKYHQKTPFVWSALPLKLMFRYHNLLDSWSGLINSLGRLTHICVSKLTIIGSNNGLSPGRRQAIIWTNAGILLTGPLGTNFSEFLIVIHIFSFNKMHLKMSSAKWRPFCLGFNVLICMSFSLGWQLRAHMSSINSHGGIFLI